MRQFIKATLILAFSLALCASAVWWTARRWTERRRTEWKRIPLEQLSNLSLTNDLVHAEIEQIKASSTTNNSDLTWANEHVLLMTNGRIHRLRISPRSQRLLPANLFLGHTSNGQWLYSSYHFCNHMQMVQFDNPPGSIAEFCATYFVRRFDGKSDDCLKLTK